ncbi:hypothetical protein FEM03_21280 [Phragmitibacter flavus]|uniref:Uncharacterized protein n=1 Tax=Phragmitibacter flavus TaxID=2576071 RepID=A0A5R8K8Q7_9BACT|nr:hypothetical protein [Phragmitibacter flavus]TLD68717.1 hypothetical protein FEM03_21280 [Phragmitibacter flavus]
MKTILAILSATLVLGAFASQAEAGDHYRRYSKSRYCEPERRVYVRECPPPRVVYVRPPVYVHRPVCAPRPVYVEPCHQPRRYHRSGFSITFTR